MEELQEKREEQPGEALVMVVAPPRAWGQQGQGVLYLSSGPRVVMSIHGHPKKPKVISTNFS